MALEERDFSSEFILAVALTFAPLAFGTTESWSRAILGGLLAVVAYRRLKLLGGIGLDALQSPPLAWAMAGLLFFAMIQALRPVPPTAVMLARGVFTVSRPLTMDWIFAWAMPFSILLFAPRLFRNQTTAVRLAWLLLICGAVVSVIGIAQQQGGNEFYYGVRRVSRFRAPFGPFPNKNHAGAFLGMSALAGAGLIATLVGRFDSLRRGGRSDEFFGRFFILLSLELLVILGLFRSNSRGATFSCVAAGAVASFLYGFRPHRLSRAIALGSLLSAGVMMLGVARYAGVNWISYIPEVAENSVIFRYAMASDGVKIIRTFPLSGIGLGSLVAAYPLWMNPVMKGYSIDHLHCDPIELATECGIPLAIGYYFAYAITLAIILKRSTAQNRPASLLSMGFAAASAAFLIHQVLEFPSHITSLHIAAMACLSAAWGLSLDEPMELPTPRPLPRLKAFVAGVGLTAYSLICLVPRVTAGYFDLLATRYPQPSKQYYQHLAARWEPTLDRHLGLAQSYRQLSIENPPAKTILLRKALFHSSAALDLHPLDDFARRLHAQLLFDLGRGLDALTFLPSR